MRRGFAGWRLALRLAAREALRSKGRTALALLMIALPVAAVVAAATLISTDDLDARESLDRRIGTVAEAGVQTHTIASLRQGIDPSEYDAGDGKEAPAATTRQITKVLGDRPTTTAQLDEHVSVRTDKGVDRSVSASEFDPGNRLTTGLARLVDGRWPHQGEVTVSRELAERGPGLGRTLVVGPGTPDQARLKIVGIAESVSERGPYVVGLPGSLHGRAYDGATLLVGGAPVTWDDVAALNRIGVTALSRSVVSDPPAAALAADRHVHQAVAGDSAQGTVTILIVVMALIEVVLLAGPSFAVGARRQAYSLALVSASGGTPRQTWRVVLASGVVVGAAASLLGVGLGIVLAFVGRPAVQELTLEWLGPFDVPWPRVAMVAVFGLFSAVFAAFVPARIAARQDVVKVLAGRRTDARISRRSPLLGLALIGLGVTGAVIGVKRDENFIAASAIVMTVGMVLLVPVLVAWLARMGDRLPLSLRFASRDAARHRTRTTPAVAAVAATVIGVVALGIGASSDAREHRETYQPRLAAGNASIVVGAHDFTGWPQIEKAVARTLPRSTYQEVKAVWPDDDGGPQSWGLAFAPPGDAPLETSYGVLTPGEAMVAEDGALPSPVVASLDSAGVRVDAADVRRTLAADGAVVFTTHRVTADRVSLEKTRWDENGDEHAIASADVPALYVTVPTDLQNLPTPAVLAPGAAAKIGAPVSVAGLLVSGPVSAAVQADLSDRVGELTIGQESDPEVYVERGYQPPALDWVVQVVLWCLAAVLMLGGTLTATFLALADARPDLATLAAVGAAPATRRGVGAAYALFIAVTGAVVGAVLGFVPGLAVVWPLTAEGTHHGPYIDVPWLLIVAVVVGLPLVAAAVVALATRARLPLVARLT